MLHHPDQHPICDPAPPDPTTEGPGLHCLELVLRNNCGKSGVDQGTDQSPKKARHYHYLTPEKRALLARKLARAAKLPQAGRASKALWIAARCQDDALVFREKETGRYVLAPYECRKKYCPACGVAWSDTLKARLLPLAVRQPARDLRHIVLTIPNAPEGDLEERIGQLYQAFREWRNRGRRGKDDRFWGEPLGYAWKLEIDKKSRSSWHPHLHLLLHSPGGIDLRRGSRARETWAKVTENAGASACLRNGIWVTAPKTSQVAREVAKYGAKPIQVAGLSSRALAELAAATKGLRWTGSAGTLHHSEPRQVTEDGRFEVVGSAMSLVNRAFSDSSVPDSALHAITTWLEHNPQHSHAFPECVRPTPQGEEPDGKQHTEERPPNSPLQSPDAGASIDNRGKPDDRADFFEGSPAGG